MTIMDLGIGIFAVLLWIFAVVIALIATVFWIVEIVDVARREFRDPTMKVVWVLIIILTHFIGALIYFFIGKRDGVLPGDPQYRT